MPKQSKDRILLASIFSVSFISACGGGGGSGDGGGVSPPPTPNAAPVASAVTIVDDNGGDVLAADTLTATYAFSDSDGDAEGSSTFQWLRDGTAISGATSLTYTVQAEDEGAQISFQVTPIAASGTTTGSAVISSALSVLEAPNAPPVASAVTIADDNGGDTVAADTLTAAYTYSDADGDAEGSSTFQWLRDGTAISGATSLTYTVQAEDEGAQISFQVTPVAASGTTTGSAVSSSSLSVLEAQVEEGPDKEEFLASMPTWSEFAPKTEPVEEEGQERIDTTVAPTIEEITDSDGLVKVCTTETVDFFDSPEEYVMFAPPTNILYPGAFVEGKSLRDGASAGDILPLNIQQRTEITVSIPACAFENNFRVVAPTLANVNSAVGAIIDEALQQGLDCVEPRGNLRVETYQNDQQRALSAGFSGKYFGFSGSASGSYSKTTSQNSVAAVFRESLYTVQIEAPQTPSNWFTDEFTPERIKELEDLERFSANNIPAYVAQVTYGRILTSTFTSSYSETDMRAAIEFKYNNPATSVEGDAAVRSQTIRENSSTTLAYIGGSADATSAMLQSNDWTEYFDVPVTASDAVPISFELRSISDNTLAVTQELTSYERTSCIDKVADNATFAFQTKESFTPSFTGTGQQTAFGDINGDGAQDIVWVNNNPAGFGEFAVALSEQDGTFEVLRQSVNPNVTNKVGDLRVVITDIDDDGSDDVVLNIINTTSTANTVYVSFFKGDEFVHSSEQNISQGSGGWSDYATFTGQMDGLRGQDLLWNNVPNSTSTNRVYIAHAVDTTVEGFDLTTDELFIRTSFIDISDNFTTYNYTFVDDFDGDGRSDILWNRLFNQTTTSSNSIYYRYGTTTGLTDFDRIIQGSNWSTYTALTGDVNGDGRADVIYPRMRNAAVDFGVYARPGAQDQRDGFLTNTFTFYNDANEHAVLVPFFGSTGAEVSPDIYLADVNGDGTDDLIINDKGNVDSLANNVAVGLSPQGNMQFTFTRAAQKLPQSEDWSLFNTYFADFNGDGRQDVIWVRNASTNDIYVGLARAN